MTEELKSNPFVESLRELADFYEQNPTLPIPTRQTINLFDITVEQIKDFITLSKKTVKKSWIESFFYATIPFGSHINLDLNIARNKVCEKIITKRKTIKQIPISYEEKEIEEEIIEWKCPDTMFEET